MTINADERGSTSVIGSVVMTVVVIAVLRAIGHKVGVNLDIVGYLSSAADWLLAVADDIRHAITAG